MIQKYTYFYGYPTQQPPLTVKTAVNQFGVMTSATAPPKFGSGVTTDVNVQEADSTSLQTYDTVSDTYFGSNGSNSLMFGSIANLGTVGAGQSTVRTMIFASPIISSEPAGNKWTTNPAATIDETYSDGHYEDRTVAADGTYVENGTTKNADGSVAAIKIDEMSTGAGTYSGPFAACPDVTSWNFTAPVAKKIALTLSSTSPYCTNSTPLEIPEWYPPNPAPFFQDSNQSTTATTPGQCGKNKGQSATEITRNRAMLDTVIGYIDLQTDRDYASSNGPLCSIHTDLMLVYYDWQGDTPSFLLVTGNGKPLATVQTTEVLVNKSSSASGAVHSAARSAMPAAAIAEFAAASQAHFDAKMNVVRAKLRDAMIQHAMHARNAKGGVR